MTMKQIIAIGGGGFTNPNQDFSLEKYLLQQTKKENPKICFLPQASAESQHYIIKFYDCFTKLGAKPSWISLFGRVENTWQEQLLNQDLIYVGGGNTKSMLALWKAWGMDELLRKAHDKGIILSGISAGAICWYEHCLTDSVWPLGVIEGLKLLPGSCCPHYDSEPERKPNFLRMVQEGEIMPGIALEDHVAAHYINGKLHKILSAKEGASAFEVGAASTLALTEIQYRVQQSSQGD